MKTKPQWLKIKLELNENTRKVRGLLKKLNLNTVCHSAHCPNLHHCFSRGTATFLILGNKCTRNCRFCAIDKAKSNEKLSLDPFEPINVANAVKLLNLNYVVITSVSRDDLPDGGANHFSKTIMEIRKLKDDCKIEVLIPDFNLNYESLKIIEKAKPYIVNHNLETVKRLYPLVRPKANYYQSLKVIEYFSNKNFITKSGIMVGLGEDFEEIEKLMKDLVNVGCQILTIGQYLQPSKKLLPVSKYYTPSEFDKLKLIGENLGLKAVYAGPLIRSSFHADIFSTFNKGS